MVRHQHDLRAGVNKSWSRRGRCNPGPTLDEDEDDEEDKDEEELGMRMTTWAHLEWNPYGP